MYNDANRDDDTKIVSVSTLKRTDKNNSTTESKNKLDENKTDSDAKSLKALTDIENDSVKAKLKQERAELINHLYDIIGTTQDDCGSYGDKDLNIPTYYVSNSSSDFHQWLESYPVSELCDHLEFCERKISSFCRAEPRQLYKRKKYGQCHSKPRKQNINKPKCF